MENRRFLLVSLLIFWSGIEFDSAVIAESKPVGEKSRQSGWKFGLVSEASENRKSSSVAKDAKRIFQSYCQKCHGANGSRSGGFDFITDLKKLGKSSYIVPGDANSSEIYQRIAASEDDSFRMPPLKDDEENPNPRPTVDEVAAVQAWILAGAPIDGVSVPFFSDGEMLSEIEADLKIQQENGESLHNIRYVTFNHLSNAGATLDDVVEYVDSFSQLINYLSWAPDIAKPVSVNTSNLVLRIRLDQYQWTEAKWDELTSNFPYRYNGRAEVLDEIRRLTLSQIPIIRGDWFGYYASRPPLNHKLLDLPETDLELENRLKIDVAANILSTENGEQRTIRSGFNNSGVSFNNRLIERHPTQFGSYWKSYDFRAGSNGKNLFETPLGPSQLERGGGIKLGAFEHDGGEIIFSLPNGLQAYFLVTGAGARLDIAPADVVFDPASPEGITNGISCMGCHSDGIKDKQDQVQEAVGGAAGSSFPAQVITRVDHLYQSSKRFSRFVDRDAGLFFESVGKASFAENQKVLLTSLSQVYDQDLTLDRVAAELGMKPSDFLDQIPRLSANMRRILSSLPSSTIKRNVFEDNLKIILSELFSDSELRQFVLPIFFWQQGQQSELASGELARRLIFQLDTALEGFQSRFGNRLLGFFPGELETYFSKPNDRVSIVRADASLKILVPFTSRLESADQLSGSLRSRDPKTEISGFEIATALANWNRQCSQFLERTQNREGVIFATCGEAPVDVGDHKRGEVRFIGSGQVLRQE